MHIGGVVVRVRAGAHPRVRRRLEACPGVSVTRQTEAGFALVVEAGTPADQEAWHRDVSSWPDVEEVHVVFQSSEVEP